jgi:hypothetical protein
MLFLCLAAESDINVGKCSDEMGRPFINRNHTPDLVELLERGEHSSERRTRGAGSYDFQDRLDDSVLTTVEVEKGPCMRDVYVLNKPNYHDS